MLFKSSLVSHSRKGQPAASTPRRLTLRTRRTRSADTRRGAEIVALGAATTEEEEPTITIPAAWAPPPSTSTPSASASHHQRSASWAAGCEGASTAYTTTPIPPLPLPRRGGRAASLAKPGALAARWGGYASLPSPREEEEAEGGATLSLSALKHALPATPAVAPSPSTTEASASPLPGAVAAGRVRVRPRRPPPPPPQCGVANGEAARLEGGANPFVAGR